MGGQCVHGCGHAAGFPCAEWSGLESGEIDGGAVAFGEFQGAGLRGEGCGGEDAVGVDAFGEERVEAGPDFEECAAVAIGAECESAVGADGDDDGEPEEEEAEHDHGGEECAADGEESDAVEDEEECGGDAPDDGPPEERRGEPTAEAEAAFGEFFDAPAAEELAAARWGKGREGGEGVSAGEGVDEDGGDESEDDADECEGHGEEDGGAESAEDGACPGEDDGVAARGGGDGPGDDGEGDAGGEADDEGRGVHEGDAGAAPAGEGGDAGVDGGSAGEGIVGGEGGGMVEGARGGGGGERNVGWAWHGRRVTGAAGGGWLIYPWPMNFMSTERVARRSGLMAAVAAWWAVGVMGALAGPAVSPAPVIDGEFGEWGAVAPVKAPEMLKPPGTTPAPALELLGVRLASRGTYVYLDIELSGMTTLQAGPAGEPTVFVAVQLPDARRLVVDMRARKAFIAGQQERAIPWETIEWAVMPTYAAKRFEVRMNLAGLEVAAGSKVLVGASVGKGAVVEWPVVLDQPAPPPPVRRSPARAEGTVARVASLNVLRDGIIKAETAAPMGRMLRAVGADVICLQEADKARPEQIGEALTKAMGGEGAGGGAWNVRKQGGEIVASRRALTVLQGKGPAALQRVLAVGVGAGAAGERPMVVLNMHLKCCGYAGSAEDATRVEQVGRVVAFIAELRGKKLGAEAEAFADAPVVMVGDMNLVGSDLPLRALTEGSGAPLRAVWLPHLIGDDCATWSEPTGVGFWPGRLDLAMVDAGRGAEAVAGTTGWVLETGALNDEELKAMGLEKGDSKSTDHRMLVVDVRPAAAGKAGERPVAVPAGR